MPWTTIIVALLLLKVVVLGIYFYSKQSPRPQGRLEEAAPREPALRGARPRQLPGGRALRKSALRAEASGGSTEDEPGGAGAGGPGSGPTFTG